MCGRRVAGNWNVLWKEKRDTTMVQRAFRRVFDYVFQKSVMLHQEAHNELEELGEPVSETKKVEEFLK